MFAVSFFRKPHDVTGATESPKIGWVSSKANGKDGVVNVGKVHKIGGLQHVLYAAVLITTCDHGGKSTLGTIFFGSLRHLAVWVISM